MQAIQVYIIFSTSILGILAFMFRYNNITNVILKATMTVGFVFGLFVTLQSFGYIVKI